MSTELIFVKILEHIKHWVLISFLIKKKCKSKGTGHIDIQEKGIPNRG